MLENYPPLLVTKLFVPRLRAPYVTRTPLLQMLDAGLDRKLVLIAAAAGFGKTTLIANWSSQHTEAVVWLSLDEQDNDPVRFLSYLIAAIQTSRPEIGQELLAALQLPQPPAVAHVLHVLVNQLAAASGRLIIVLDDYHAIENRVIHSALAFLLDHMPPQMTVVLLTRSDPPLPLARLRARNQLLELRIDALRFTGEETEALLNQVMGLNLSHDATGALHMRTEGWVVGLQLAGLAMQPLGGEAQMLIRDFTGSHRFVLDYLIEEVLSRQPLHIRRFLLQTSILYRMNGSLCDAVTGEADGQAMLEQLERNNLFLISLDGARFWYRYHHLFSELLRSRLRAEYPAIVMELYGRAAHWYEQSQLSEEAVGYALAAEDYEYAAQLISGPAASTVNRGEVAILLDWYKAFPTEFIFRHVRLSLQFGLAFALNGRWDEAELLLTHVEQQSSESFPGEALFLSYLIAGARQDAVRLATIAAEAASRRQADPLTKLALGMVAGLSGDLRRASQFMIEAQAASEHESDSSLALTALFHQCRFQVFLGALHHAYELSQRALQRIDRLGRAGLPMAIFAHVSLGRILIEWNDLDKAADHLSQAVQLSERTGFVTGLVSSATMMLAEVKQGQGDVYGANQSAVEALAYAERYDPPPEVVWLRVYQVRLWLTQGNIAAAIDWMHLAANQELPTSLFYPRSIRTVTQARLLLAQRKPAEAIVLLTRLLNEPPDLLTVEALAVLALARQSQSDHVHALIALEQGLLLAQAENRVRAFHDLAAPMASLLARFCEAHPENGFAQALLATYPALAANSASPVDTFSERELEVLRLIVAGQSNDEIAQALTLAVSTVKWYINTLYGKLHVKTRSQAIARTHQLKLLAD